jgi:hypothetical protein
MMASRPPGPSPTRTWSRTAPPPRRCTKCAARGATTRRPADQRQRRANRGPPASATRLRDSPKPALVIVVFTECLFAFNYTGSGHE